MGMKFMPDLQFCKELPEIKPGEYRLKYDLTLRVSGKLFGFQVMPDIYEPVTIFILAPGAFLVLAFLVAARNKIMKKLEAKGKKVVKAQGCCEGGCASCGGCDGHVFPTGQEKE